MLLHCGFIITKKSNPYQGSLSLIDLFFRVFNLFYINAIAFYLAYLICRLVFKPQTRIDFAITVFGLTTVIITGVTLLFGSLRLMQPAVINSVFTLLLIPLIFIRLKFKPDHNFEKLKLPADITKPKMFISVFFILCATLAFLIILLNSLRFPPIDYDALYFYLPTVAIWFKSNGLAVWKDAMIDAKYYPCGFFLFHYWLIFILKSDSFIWIIQPLFLVFSILNIYAISRKLGMPAHLSIGFCAMVICMPMTIGLSVKENNDMGTFYFFTLTIYLIFEFNRTQKLRDIFFAGTSAGTVLGIKYSGIHWVIALSTGMALFVLHSKYKHKIRAVILWFSGIILWGSYWYIRNLILTGNFLFPAKIKIAGMRLYSQNNLYSQINHSFMQKVESSTILQNFHYLWTHSADWYLPLFGFIYFLLILPIGYMSFEIIKSAWTKKTGLQTIFFITVLAGALLLTTVPATVRTNSNIRYGYHIIIMISLALPLIFKKNNTAGWIIIFIFCANIIYGLSMYTKYVAAIIPLATAGGAIAVIYSPLRMNKFTEIVSGYVSKYKPVFIVCALLITMPAGIGICRLVDKYRFDPENGYSIIDPYINDGWKWLSHNICGENIGYMDKSYIYPLFNTDFSNNIIFIGDNDKSRFFKNIESAKTDCIFFQSKREWINGVNVFAYKFPEQYLWLKQNPDYHEMFANKAIAIFKKR